MLSEVTTWTSADFMMLADGYGNGKQYILNINSPGGDPFAAFAIHDYMRAKGIKATARIYGHAASAAALIACACERVEMGELSHLMIHNAYGGTDMGLLESLNAKQAEVFSAKTGKSAKEVRKMMEAETWMDAKEAKRMGFADSVIKDLAIAAIYKANYMEEIKGTIEEVVETIEQTPIEQVADETATEEVEVEIPVTPAEAIQAGFSGKMTAKVKVNGELKAAVAALTAELKATATEIDEIKAEAEALRDKVKAEGEAKAKAEADLKAMTEERDALSAKATEMAAAIDTLKNEPIKAEAAGTADKAVQVPGGGPSTATATKEGRKEARHQAVQDSMQRIIDKRNPAAAKAEA